MTTDAQEANVRAILIDLQLTTTRNDLERGKPVKPGPLSNLLTDLHHERKELRVALSQRVISQLRAGLSGSDRECIVLHSPYCTELQGDTPCTVAVREEVIQRLRSGRIEHPSDNFTIDDDHADPTYASIMTFDHIEDRDAFVAVLTEDPIPSTEEHLGDCCPTCGHGTGGHYSDCKEALAALDSHEGGTDR